MKEKKTKEQILEDIDQNMEECCIRIFENLQANEVTLLGSEILDFSNSFYKKLDHQNNKVIVTGDEKYHG